MVDKNTLFGGMLTTLGAAKKTYCDAVGIPWEPSYMLIGDAGGTDPVPSPGQTKLINQVHRAPINQLRVSPTDANVLIAEVVLPPDVGGWWMRELGLEDKDGVFCAVASVAPSYKPNMAQGSSRNQVVRMHLITNGTANISLKIDPSVVLATREFVDLRIREELDKLDTKQSVRVATTAPVVLSGLQTLDGVALRADDRVLVKQQADAKANGLYIAAAGLWRRVGDADASAEVTPNLLVAIEEGATLADTLWMLTSNGPIVLGTTALVFEQIAGANGVMPGTYRQVTIDRRGLVVGGSNPTTLAGQGITDAFTKNETNAAIKTAVDGVVDGAPAALNTLKKLAAAIALKLDLIGGTLTGPLFSNSKVQLENGTESAPGVVWKTPTYQVQADVRNSCWNLNLGAAGDVFLLSFIDKNARVYGRVVWDQGNQLALGMTAATGRAALELHDSAKEASLLLTGGSLSGPVMTSSRFYFKNGTETTPVLYWETPTYQIGAYVTAQSWRLNQGGVGDAFHVSFVDKSAKVYGRLVWDKGNQLELGVTAATARAALEIHNSAKEATLPLTGGALTGNLTTNSRLILQNGSEDSPEVHWVTPTRSFWADVASAGWRLYDVGVGTALSLVSATKEMRVYDKLVWNEGNQLALGTTAASARAALELHDSAKAASLPLTGGNVSGQIVSTVSENYRIAGGSYGSFWRQDGNSLYLMLTEPGSPLGAYSAARPLVVNLVSGQAHISGNAGSATKLATARSINGVPFDGTSNITVYDSTKVTQNGHNIVLGWDVAGMRAWVNNVDMGTVWSDINAGAKSITAQANAAAGGVGTYAFMKNTGISVGPGELLAGSQLTYADTSAGSGGGFATGTWRCMGWGYKTNGTLYVRVN